MAESWLCRDDMDRTRLLDMEQRIRPMRRRAMGVLAFALVLGSPWIGLWTLVPLAFAAVIFELAERRLEESERPEYVMFFAWAVAELTIAACVLLTDGPYTATLAWLAIPVVTLHSRFSSRGVYVGVALAVFLVIAVALIGDAQGTLDDPTVIFAPISLIIAISILSTALMRSDLQHRSEAVIDPLTGMLNRKAVMNRADELAQQSEITGQPVGMIIGDLDHFKDVNDSRGHRAGDAVLKDFAYLLRKRLRAFDLAYRIGGEEFLVLLPGADIAEAASVAEELRQLLERTPVGDGIAITMSFGVSGSASGERFVYERVFVDADAALYDAKRMGRNRVRTSLDSAPAEHEPAGVA